MGQSSVSRSSSELHPLRERSFQDRGTWAEEGLSPSLDHCATSAIFISSSRKRRLEWESCSSSMSTCKRYCSETSYCCFNSDLRSRTVSCDLRNSRLLSPTSWYRESSCVPCASHMSWALPHVLSSPPEMLDVL
eukprot:Skav234358  [mRNA]  locus=scaffold1274:170490:175995:- [translate_table: standard]